MPSSVIGRPISGSLTPASADVTCSAVGSGEFMPSCYVPGTCGPRHVPGTRTGGARSRLTGAARRRHPDKRWLTPEGLPGDRVEEQLAPVAIPHAVLAEIEHVVQAARLRVSAAGDGRQTPVVLDELGDRRLVGQRAVDEVGLRP